MNTKSELIKRLAALLLNGFTAKQAKEKLMNGEITSKEFTENLADKYVEEAVELIDTDVGQDQKLQYPRLVHLYQLCLEKKDYTNAAKVWKELQTFNNGSIDNEITVKFIKE